MFGNIHFSIKFRTFSSRRRNDSRYDARDESHLRILVLRAGSDRGTSDLTCESLEHGASAAGRGLVGHVVRSGHAEGDNIQHGVAAE